MGTNCIENGSGEAGPLQQITKTSLLVWGNVSVDKKGEREEGKPLWVQRQCKHPRKRLSKFVKSTRHTPAPYKTNVSYRIHENSHFSHFNLITSPVSWMYHFEGPFREIVSWDNVLSVLFLGIRG